MLKCKRFAQQCLLSTSLMVNLAVAEEEIILVDDEENDEMVEILIDDSSSSDEEVILMESDTEENVQIDEATDEREQVVEASEPASESIDSFTQGDWNVGFDRFWLESSLLVQNGQAADYLNYGHLGFSANWTPSNQWEAKLSARLDGYQQTGALDWTGLDADYGDTYLRYRGENTRITIGAQTIIWGRVDEVPPSDRLSTVDVRRFILDDLQDRRLARLGLRVETFVDDRKFDFIYMPTFREAELPDQKSIWYPIDRNRGKVLGVVTPPPLAALAVATIVDQAPSRDGAVGLRVSATEENFDYALSVQYGRQTTPYFSYSATNNRFTAHYPRSFALGGDIGFETEGTTWRFEAAYLSDVAVTRSNLTYNQVEGFNWVAGMEFYPGDADTRINIQLAGNHLINASHTLERNHIYNLNGAINIPFAEDRWEVNIRYFIGLDEYDVYVNPEITFLGWEPHEIYLETHYFDGNSGTLGGFHQDHSLMTLGWRAKF